MIAMTPKELLEFSANINQIVREGGPQFEYDWHLAMHAARGDDEYDNCSGCQKFEQAGLKPTSAALTPEQPR